MVDSEKRSSRTRLPRRKKAAGQHTPTVLDLVRSGVERFILKDANMISFRKAILRAAKKGVSSPQTLTGVDFRRIVKKAIRDRKLGMKSGSEKPKR